MEGFLMSTYTLYRHFSDRLEAPESLPEGLDVPELQEAHDAAMEAFDAADDVISAKDAYEVLVVADIDALAEEKYLRALRAGDKSAKFEGDRLRKLRAETIAKAEKATQEAIQKRRAYEKLLKKYSLEIAKLAARRLEEAESSVVEAETAFRDAYRQYQHAVARMEDAVHRAGLVTVVNVRQIRGNAQAVASRNFGDSVRLTIQSVRRAFDSFAEGWREATESGTTPPRGVAGESASFDHKGVWQA